MMPVVYWGDQICWITISWHDATAIQSTVMPILSGILRLERSLVLAVCLHNEPRQRNPTMLTAWCITPRSVPFSHCLFHEIRRVFHTCELFTSLFVCLIQFFQIWKNSWNSCPNINGRVVMSKTDQLISNRERVNHKPLNCGYVCFCLLDLGRQIHLNFFDQYTMLVRATLIYLLHHLRTVGHRRLMASYIGRCTGYSFLFFLFFLFVRFDVALLSISIFSFVHCELY